MYLSTAGIFNADSDMGNMRKVVPTEQWEQEQLVKWLENEGYKFTAIPNSTYTPSHAAKAKNTRAGLRPGFPDLIVLAKMQILCIEMKRLKGGKLSPEQRGWLDALAECGAISMVCYGHQDAIARIKAIELY